MPNFRKIRQGVGRRYLKKDKVGCIMSVLQEQYTHLIFCDEFGEGDAIMSDLGNDAGSTALSITAKVIEALLKLLDKAWNGIQSAFSAERRLARANLKNAKTENQRNAALKKINGKVGEINKKVMERTGLPLYPFRLELKLTDMQRFASLAERYGLLWYGVMDKYPMDAEGKRGFQLTIFEKDVPKLREVVDRVKAELVAEQRDKRITELEEKGEGRSPEEEQELQMLYKERNGEAQKTCDNLNDKTANDVGQAVEAGKAPEENGFDESLNKFAGRHIDKDAYSVLVDASDPAKFIICHGQQAVDPKGQEYPKTDYKVFKNDVLVMETHDERFKGRTSEYWPEQKALMKEAGDFGDKLLKFPSVEAAQQWRDRVEKENEEELGPMPEFKKENIFKRTYAQCREEAFDPNRKKVEYIPVAKRVEVEAKETEAKEPATPEVKTGPVIALPERTLGGDVDYKAIRLKLEETLQENGFRLDENEKVVYENGDPLPAITDNMDATEKMLIAEGKVIEKQFAAYKKMEDLSEGFALAKANAMAEKEGTSEYTNAMTELDKTESAYREVAKYADELKEQRSAINGVQVEQEGRAERAMSKEAEVSKDKADKDKEAPEETGPSDREVRSVDHRNRPSGKQWDEKVADLKNQKDEVAKNAPQKEILKNRTGKDIGGRD